MTGSKNEAMSSSDVSNISVREDAEVMMDHEHPCNDNIDEPNKSIITVTNIQATNDMQEDITHEKHATIEERTINSQLTRGSFVCPWRATHYRIPIPSIVLFTATLYTKNHDAENFTVKTRVRTGIVRLATTYHFDSGRHEAEDSKSDPITATLFFDDDSSADVSPESLRWMCRESSEVFRENYHRSQGVRPIDDEDHRPQDHDEPPVYEFEAKAGLALMWILELPGGNIEEAIVVLGQL
ncbi:hypothetical protein BOTCAL_0170g00080 [Botryotinia calthae]|uniref:Uncharacterized protein n=1 Tax=Botryotinia calthae TaxID=38488 RepID=A0A4Y8D151_9HELO|nr:hypothetical protein BOTCAL_0170g00080 [Botryotinia calthae]